MTLVTKFPTNRIVVNQKVRIAERRESASAQLGTGISSDAVAL